MPYSSFQPHIMLIFTLITLLLSSTNAMTYVRQGNDDHDIQDFFADHQIPMHVCDVSVDGSSCKSNATSTSLIGSTCRSNDMLAKVVGNGLDRPRCTFQGVEYLGESAPDDVRQYGRMKNKLDKIMTTKCKCSRGYASAKAKRMAKANKQKLMTTLIRALDSQLMKIDEEVQNKRRTGDEIVFSQVKKNLDTCEKIRYTILNIIGDDKSDLLKSDLLYSRSCSALTGILSIETGYELRTKLDGLEDRLTDLCNDLSHQAGNEDSLQAFNRMLEGALMFVDRIIRGHYEMWELSFLSKTAVGQVHTTKSLVSFGEALLVKAWILSWKTSSPNSAKIIRSLLLEAHYILHYHSHSHLTRKHEIVLQLIRINTLYKKLRHHYMLPEKPNHFLSTLSEVILYDIDLIYRLRIGHLALAKAVSTFDTYKSSNKGMINEILKLSLRETLLYLSEAKISFTNVFGKEHPLVGNIWVFIGLSLQEFAGGIAVETAKGPMAPDRETRKAITAAGLNQMHPVKAMLEAEKIFSTFITSKDDDDDPRVTSYDEMRLMMNDLYRFRSGKFSSVLHNWWYVNSESVKGVVNPKAYASLAQVEHRYLTIPIIPAKVTRSYFENEEKKIAYIVGTRTSPYNKLEDDAKLASYRHEVFRIGRLHGRNSVKAFLLWISITNVHIKGVKLNTALQSLAVAQHIYTSFGQERKAELMKERGKFLVTRAILFTKIAMQSPSSLKWFELRQKDFTSLASADYAKAFRIRELGIVHLPYSDTSNAARVKEYYDIPSHSSEILESLQELHEKTVHMDENSEVFGNEKEEATNSDGDYLLENIVLKSMQEVVKSELEIEVDKIFPELNDAYNFNLPKSSTQSLMDKAHHKVERMMLDFEAEARREILHEKAVVNVQRILRGYHGRATARRRKETMQKLDSSDQTSIADPNQSEPSAPKLPPPPYDPTVRGIPVNPKPVNDEERELREKYSRYLNLDSKSIAVGIRNRMPISVQETGERIKVEEQPVSLLRKSANKYRVPMDADETLLAEEFDLDQEEADKDGKEKKEIELSKKTQVPSITVAPNNKRQRIAVPA
eukprot:g1503.t1